MTSFNFDDQRLMAKLIWHAASPEYQTEVELNASKKRSSTNY